MSDSNRCEEFKGLNVKAVIKGQEVVGVKDLVRRKMALDETMGRGSLRWKIEMSSHRQSGERPIDRSSTFKGNIDSREEGERGKRADIFINSILYSYEPGILSRVRSSNLT